jgi:hypothetical protein
VPVSRPALAAAREDFLAIVAAEEPIRAGGHREALGWVLDDLHADRPLAMGEHVTALTDVIAGTPELGKTIVAIAGFQPARIDYVPRVAATSACGTSGRARRRAVGHRHHPARGHGPRDAQRAELGAARRDATDTTG